MDVLNLDIPFDCRFTCWFCGEGSHQTIVTTLVTHQMVNIPICDECKSYRCHNEASSLVRLEKLIKDKIVKQSAKALSIGANWTEKELQESELIGSAFDGFKKSGWRMFLIARDRVNYSGWELSIDGVTIENTAEDENFEFDGLTFTSFISMLDYLSSTFSLNKEFLEQVLTLYGDNRAIEAVKFCRLVPNESKSERDKALEDLIESFKEKEALKP
ncbi:hypothetical protein [Colwellia sp. 20A7]|uniref:hypothetical protein n=1 Tax=Colwellia sp. 20A7 TaxID=2689569 RepID=UPI00135726FC|nr:hypothetical protein [Colwellia sp. 20A7]